jgi:hypothetical protein
VADAGRTAKQNAALAQVGEAPTAVATPEATHKLPLLLRPSNAALFNGTAIGSLTLSEEPGVQTVTFDADLLQTGTNTLTFDLPDARPAGVRDQRLRGIQFVTLAIEG